MIMMIILDAAQKCCKLVQYFAEVKKKISAF